MQILTDKKRETGNNKITAQDFNTPLISVKDHSDRKSIRKQQIRKCKMDSKF